MKIWYLQPLLYVICLWFFVLYPRTTQKFIPNIYQCVYSHNVTDVESFLPQIPTNRSVLWQLSQIDATLRMQNLTEVETENLLSKAHNLTGWKKKITQSDLGKFNMWIDETDHHQGTLSRIRGLFDFVHLIWFVSILMGLYFFRKVLMITLECLTPLFLIFSKLVGKIIIAIAPAFEPISYFILFVISVQGSYYPNGMGLYVSMVGLLGLIPALLFSRDKHHNEYEFKTYHEHQAHKSIITCLFYMVIAFSFMPMAIYYQSTLLGYLTVGSLLSGMGFSIMCRELCWVIGFDNDFSMHRVVISILFVEPLFVIMKLCSDPNTYGYIFEPFMSAVLSGGTTIYFLAMLMITSRLYIQSDDAHHFQSQLVMILSLSVTLFFGTYYNITSLYNVGITYMIIYAMEKIAEKSYKSELFPVIMFIYSVILYFISYYLYSHPDFLTSLIDDSYLKR
jgi:hypothetical protein